MKEVWESISVKTIRTCFTVCGLTLKLDGSEDHEWCTHTFGEKYREVLVKQREVWEQAHGMELEQLQLPVIPEEGAGTKGTVSGAVKATPASVTTINLDDEDDEDGGIIDLVDLDDDLIEAEDGDEDEKEGEKNSESYSDQ